MLLLTNLSPCSLTWPRKQPSFGPNSTRVFSERRKEKTMKAMVQNGYSSPDDIRELRAIDKPVVRDTLWPPGIAQDKPEG
jgi:hypothetical protein